MIGFIVNPVSGNGRGASVWRDVERVLQQRNVRYLVKFTSKSGEAKELAIEMMRSDKPPTIVAVGGDGTVNEVANGIYDCAQPCRLGYIAAGSGNDFAIGHGLPLKHLEALEVILSSSADAAIDVLKVGNRIAISSIGVGLDGQVAKLTNQARYKKLFNRLRLGKLSYVMSLIRALFTFEPSDVLLEVDGVQTTCRNVWLTAIANIPYYGGGMMICPRALPNDGSAEICVVSNLARWRLLRLFPLVYSGKHADLPEVQFFRGSRIEIKSAKPLFVHTDGEVMTQTPLSIEVIKEKLRIVIK